MTAVTTNNTNSTNNSNHDHHHDTHAQHGSGSGHGSLKSYIIGFILSLLLTIIPFTLVINHMLKLEYLIGAVVILAIMQLFVQLIFFLHLGSESKPRWNLTAFVFSVIIVAILVAGSLWIMYNLNYNMMH
jgi:cytochrome o ubiquinol oxidase subunit IV